MLSVEKKRQQQNSYSNSINENLFIHSNGSCTYRFCTVYPISFPSFIDSIKRKEIVWYIEYGFFVPVLTLGLWQSSDDIRIAWIGDGQCAYTEIFTACCAQFDVVATVMVDASLGQHGVVFDFGFSVNT